MEFLEMSNIIPMKKKVKKNVIEMKKCEDFENGIIYA